MIVKVKYDGNLNDLLKIRPEFSAIKQIKIGTDQARKWQRDFGYSHDIQIAIIGKTGYGKSSTVNAIFGDQIMKTSAVEACTKEIQSLEFKIREGNYLSFADLPGIGENQKSDKRHLSKYSAIVKKSDAIIYLLKADTRDFSIDIDVFNSIFDFIDKRKIIIAVNCCDKIEPVNRRYPFVPTFRQNKNLIKKVKSIEKSFGRSYKIILYSALNDWKIEYLCENIVEVILANRQEINLL